jgi:hypothetical protein
VEPIRVAHLYRPPASGRRLRACRRRRGVLIRRGTAGWLVKRLAADTPGAVAMRLRARGAHAGRARYLLHFNLARADRPQRNARGLPEAGPFTGRAGGGAGPARWSNSTFMGISGLPDWHSPSNPGMEGGVKQEAGLPPRKTPIHCSVRSKSCAPARRLLSRPGVLTPAVREPTTGTLPHHVDAHLHPFPRNRT